jgi:alpha-tubulin suppressor-like RCC1 family protein
VAPGAPCVGDADCPAPASACLTSSCRAGRCVAAPAAAGPVPDIQVAGDCRQAVCDGQGHLVSRADEHDVPADDDEVCTEERCAGETPEHHPLPAGSVCGRDKRCSTSGTCVACVAPAKRCGEGFIEACSAEGAWTREATCSGRCEGGVCTPFTAVALGASHSCALAADGSVACWGDNVEAQLGHAHREGAGARAPKSGPDSAMPALVLGLKEVAAIAVGDEHACALRRDGAVRCWGSNDFGQLGDGTNAERDLPVAPAGLREKVVQIAAGDYHTCALLDDGSARCWGNNEEGQLGTGGIDRPKGPGGPAIMGMAAPEGPALVHSLGVVTAIESRDDLTCALDTRGLVACWGIPIGYGAMVEHAARRGKSRPTAVRGLREATALTLGRSHSCALLRDKTAVCWGDNDAGQLGDGTTTARLSPTPVAGLAGIEELRAGGYSTCARLGEGSVRCWGSNGSGQLGDGTTTSRATPTAVPGLREVQQLSMAASRRCATLKSGAIVCWGETRFGELGPSSEKPLLSPTPLALGSIAP